MRGEGNHKIPGSFAPENMEKTGAERVKYSLACQHEDAIPIKFVSYAQKCSTVLCTFAVALRKESVDRNPTAATRSGRQAKEKGRRPKWASSSVRGASPQSISSAARSQNRLSRRRQTAPRAYSAATSAVSCCASSARSTSVRYASGMSMP